MRNVVRVFVSIGSLAGLIGSTAVAESFELANGDKVTGEVIDRTDSMVVIEHPVFGRIEIPTAHLKGEEPPNPGLFGTGFLEGWKREIALGLNGAEGNSVNLDARGSLAMAYEDEERRWDIGAAFIIETDDREANQQNATVALRHDWRFWGRWYVFGQGTYDYDDFKDWEHRVGGAAGPGYEFIMSETIDLRSGIGLSFQRELYGEKDNLFGGFWGVEFAWRMNSIATFELTNQLTPYFSDLGEIRNLTTANLKVALLEDPGLNLNLGITNDYESNTAPGDEANDVEYFTTIGLEF